MASKSVDLTGHTTKGWAANGGTVKDGGSRLLFTANGSATARLHSPSTFTMPAAHRLRVSFSIRNGAKSTDVRARAYIDPNASGPVYGAFVAIKPGKSRKVKAELDVGAGTTFTIGVDMDQANGSPLANTHQIYVSNVNLEKAYRRPQ